MSNTSFLLSEDPPNLQYHALIATEAKIEPKIEIEQAEAQPEIQIEAPPKTTTYVDIRMQRAMEAMVEIENGEHQEGRSQQTRPKFAHVDSAGLIWGLLANAIFGFFASIATGWAAIFSYLGGSDKIAVALWSLLFTHLANALCGSLVYRVCYRDTNVVRWDLNEHARYNIKIFSVVLVVLQCLFALSQPSLIKFLSILLTPIAVWLGAMWAEDRYKTGLIR
jgi:hypothetical protein